MELDRELWALICKHARKGDYERTRDSTYPVFLVPVGFEHSFEWIPMVFVRKGYWRVMTVHSQPDEVPA